MRPATGWQPKCRAISSRQCDVPWRHAPGNVAWGLVRCGHKGAAWSGPPEAPVFIAPLYRPVL
eukprot:5989303-Prorocentrum_lima.AAC.1